MQASAADICTSNTSNATETPDLTQGPYHITEVPELFRSNVTEGQEGIPLRLEIEVRCAGAPWSIPSLPPVSH